MTLARMSASSATKRSGWLFTNIVVSYKYRKFCRATKVVATICSIHETGRIARLS